jgi:MerR family transcriptional regulator/heat shock protein HspR
MHEAKSEHESIDPVFSIGALAREVGLSVSAVRKYANEGLISAHRLFSREDVSRVRHIHSLIQDAGLNMEGIRRMQALLPCWDLLPCGEETRESCPAYRDSTRPCWMINGLQCAPQGNECRRCVVYRFGSLCTEDLKRLLYDRGDFPRASAAIRELSQRLRSARREV